MDGEQGHEPGTSASTIRGLRHLGLGLLAEPSQHDSAYHPPSPHSAFQSEPGSPSGDSISSFPSVSSSFLFSSGPASPPHPHSEPESELGDSTSGLVIPSLTLPSPSRRPTPYGQTLGELRLLLLGPKGADMNALASRLVDDNEDVVEVGLWEEDCLDCGSTRTQRKAVLRASTDWIEHRDAHGLERIEPARNVEIVELPSYDPHDEVTTVVDRVLTVIHSPFYQVLEILNREHPPSSTVAHLLSSPTSPLHTALIMLASPDQASSPSEKALIAALGPHVPIILLPSSSSDNPSVRPSQRNASYRRPSQHLSNFRPATIDALRTGLFRAPSTLAALRTEAVARFLRWREVERAVERVQWGIPTPSASQSSSLKAPLVARPHPQDLDSGRRGWWDKEVWEAQWEGELSQEVAIHLRRRRADTAHRITPLSSLPTTRAVRQTSYFHGERTFQADSAALETPMPRDTGRDSLFSPPCPSAAFDPLHLPSLVVFSFSLLGALRTRLARTLGFTSGRPTRPAPRLKAAESQAGGGFSFGSTFSIGLALVGAFCAGVGIGLLAARF